MRINIYSIEKSSKDEYKPITDNFKKMIRKYALIEETEIFDKKIAQAQNINDIMAKSSYTKAFLPILERGGFNVALDPEGKRLNSFEFSEFFDNISNLNFFIGGAYGFEREFLKSFDKVITLSDLTLSHKVAKVVLFEQIYRGLTIKNNHPYHK
jgi:23S rRNA (pseudouridine1915-N3)-methyltransferase